MQKASYGPVTVLLAHTDISVCCTCLLRLPVISAMLVRLTTVVQHCNSPLSNSHAMTGYMQAELSLRLHWMPSNGPPNTVISVAPAPVTCQASLRTHIHPRCRCFTWVHAEQAQRTRTTTLARGMARISRSTPATTTTPRSTRSCRRARRAGSSGTTGSAWTTVRRRATWSRTPPASAYHVMLTWNAVIMPVLEDVPGEGTGSGRVHPTCACPKHQGCLRAGGSNCAPDATLCGLHTQVTTSGAGTCVSSIIGWAGRTRAATRPPARAAASRLTRAAPRPHHREDSGRR